MEPLLFLAHRIPYPPNKGDKVRSWNILRHLAERYRVYLGCFIDDAEDQIYAARVAEICAGSHIVRLRPGLAKLRSLPMLAAGAPLTLGYYRDGGLKRWVDKTREKEGIRRVFVFSSAMAQYALDWPADRARVVIDFVDVDSDKWTQYAARKRFPGSWVYGREARTLGAYERRAAMRADASLFVSEAEAALFRELAPESAARTQALSNGVDLDFFDPEADYPDPFASPEPALVFTGAMDYWANVDAVQWFARDILPGVRQRVRDAAFWIVGANPVPEVRRLGALPGVYVTGRVPDVRPYIAHAAAVVAPLRIARGVQNKVLEAMAMAKAVVVTPQALDGITAVSGEDLLVAADQDPFACAVSDLIERGDRVAIGRRARSRVVAAYGWANPLSRLNAILEGSAV